MENAVRHTAFSLIRFGSVQAVSMGGLEAACKTTPPLHTDTLGIVIHIGPPTVTLHKNAQLH